MHEVEGSGRHLCHGLYLKRKDLVCSICRVAGALVGHHVELLGLVALEAPMEAFRAVRRESVEVHR
jgi:hypothetical protein